MATTWQTMEEAALTLGVSSRTLHRRITKGEYETRLNGGRREVLVEVGDVQQQPEPAASETADASQTDRPQTSAQAGGLSDTSMLALHEDRIRRTDLAIAAYQQSIKVAAGEVRRWRIGARVAWSCAATAITALFVTGLWATHRLTAASAQVTTLSGQVRQLSDRTDTQSRQLEQYRQQAETARVDAARAQGALSVQQQRVAAAARQLSDGVNASTASAAPAATTQPSFLERMGISWPFRAASVSERSIDRRPLAEPVASH